MPANGNLEVLGRVSERCKHDLLMETNVLLLPSIAESFGQVYLEAWLRKKPVIGINYGATASLIDHDRDGLLVDFEDIDAMETALRRYLADPSLRHRHGNAGYLKARRYDWPLICRKLEDIYRSLEESGSKPKLS
jgi:glycosyltransferase involved in cell wall biosynthesis